MVEENTDLYILWTNDNPITAKQMVFMYAMNSMIQGWWEKVTIIAWGAAASLIAQNIDIQKKIPHIDAMGEVL